MQKSWFDVAEDKTLNWLSDCTNSNEFVWRFTLEHHCSNYTGFNTPKQQNYVILFHTTAALLLNLRIKTETTEIDFAIISFTSTTNTTLWNS